MIRFLFTIFPNRAKNIESAKELIKEQIKSFDQDSELNIIKEYFIQECLT